MPHNGSQHLYFIKTLSLGNQIQDTTNLYSAQELGKLYVPLGI